VVTRPSFPPSLNSDAQPQTLDCVSNLHLGVRRQSKLSGGPHSASAGQCGTVATIVRAMLGGELVSAEIDAQSHWFNRSYVAGDFFDVDLTGDQFGLPPVQLAESHINMRQDVAHCQAFLQRAALFLRAVGDDNYAAVEQDSRVADTRCGDGANNVVPILQKYVESAGGR
jgi:hypothetical protein